MILFLTHGWKDHLEFGKDYVCSSAGVAMERDKSPLVTDVWTTKCLPRLLKPSHLDLGAKSFKGQENTVLSKLADCYDTYHYSLGYYLSSSTRLFGSSMNLSSDCCIPGKIHFCLPTTGHLPLDLLFRRWEDPTRFTRVCGKRYH